MDYHQHDHLMAVEPVQQRFFDKRPSFIQAANRQQAIHTGGAQSKNRSFIRSAKRCRGIRLSGPSHWDEADVHRTLTECGRDRRPRRSIMPRCPKCAACIILQPMHVSAVISVTTSTSALHFMSTKMSWSPSVETTAKT